MKCGGNGICPLWIVAVLAVFLTACGNGTTSTATQPAPPSLPDTLRVGTLYSPTTYFQYRDEAMGYEYDMVCQYARSAGIGIDLTVAPNFPELVEMLDSGRIDLIACRVPVTSEYKDVLRYCGPVDVSTQVLVQQVRRDSNYVSDVTELIGRDVYVEDGTKYYQRLRNLDDEVGGGIRIHALDRDTLVTRDLVEMVARGEVPLTVVDGDIARLEKTYYDNIDVSMAVSLEQKSAWAVARDNAVLAESIDKWSAGIADNKEIREIHRRYFELSKSKTDGTQPYGASGGPAPLMADGTTISQYDAFFRKYAPEIDWDWRLLAAVAYEESRFDNSATSWAGAAGVMQIMPRTASLNGLPASEIRNPERNIATGVKIFKALDAMFRKRVPDSGERLKFVLAAYNSGQGHIFDAMALADKFGMDASRWHGNVRDAVLMKSRQEYYTDPVVKHGYFHGNETVSYVDKVLRTYDYYKSHAPA